MNRGRWCTQRSKRLNKTKIRFQHLSNARKLKAQLLSRDSSRPHASIHLLGYTLSLCPTHFLRHLHYFVAMSQRRMTLASIDTNKHATQANGIPRESKVHAPFAAVRARPSLAMRRSSVAPNGNMPRAGDGWPRASMVPGQRRSVGMGRVSLAPGMLPPMPMLKDTRLRSKNARAAMEANLMAFLERTGSVSYTHLTLPTKA